MVNKALSNLDKGRFICKGEGIIVVLDGYTYNFYENNKRWGLIVFDENGSTYYTTKLDAYETEIIENWILNQ